MTSWIEFEWNVHVEWLYMWPLALLIIDQAYWLRYLVTFWIVVVGVTVPHQKAHEYNIERGNPMCHSFFFLIFVTKCFFVLINFHDFLFLHIGSYSRIRTPGLKVSHFFDIRTWLGCTIRVIFAFWYVFFCYLSFLPCVTMVTLIFVIILIQLLEFWLKTHHCGFCLMLFVNQ